MTPATHPKMTAVSITVDLAEDYTDIREQVAKLCQDFNGEYWRDLEKQPPSGSYPTAFIEALTAAGYLAALIPEEYGGAGLPDGTIDVRLRGHTGQSFGFTLAKGVRLTVEGDANDYCGKGLSGGEIVVAPGDALLSRGFVAEDNVVVGNVALYGATSGSAYFRGKGGEQ